MAKILVIDDDPTVRRVIVELLEEAGHSVAVAENGRQGFALFRKDPHDLVVTDIIMPEQDGIETLKLIRRLRPDAKVIAISGGGHVGDAAFLEVARALGAVDAIAKPFDPDDFIRRVARCLAGA